MKRFDGYGILVTGGGQGIGRAIVRGFLEQGAMVQLAEWDEEAAHETASDLEALGRVEVCRTDVADEAQVQRAVAETLRRFGRLDVLVNNAATAHPGPPESLSRADWDRVLAVNLTGPFLCAKHAAPALRQARGAMVQIASTRALMSEPHTEAYSASKGGLVALTHALAASLAPEVRVNCISPGWIETGPWLKASERREPRHSAADRTQHFSGRVGVPEDVARAVLFLCDRDNGFITGTNLIVDGGMTRKMTYV